MINTATQGVGYLNAVPVTVTRSEQPPLFSVRNAGEMGFGDED